MMGLAESREVDMEYMEYMEVDLEADTRGRDIEVMVDGNMEKKD